MTTHPTQEAAIRAAALRIDLRYAYDPQAPITAEGIRKDIAGIITEELSRVALPEPSKLADTDPVKTAAMKAAERLSRWDQQFFKAAQEDDEARASERAAALEQLSKKQGRTKP